MNATKCPDNVLVKPLRSFKERLDELDNKYSAQITFTGKELLALFIVAGKIGGHPDSSLRSTFSGIRNEDERSLYGFILKNFPEIVKVSEYYYPLIENGTLNKIEFKSFNEVLARA